MIERQNWEELAPFIAAAGADPKPMIDRLRHFATQVLEWNRGVSNLISRKDEDRIVARHLRESVEAAAWLQESGASRWLDFGSGAGFPAIPLALLGVGTSWILVESRRPKTLFMRKALQDLETTGIEVFHGRLEQLRHEQPEFGTVDAFTSRATMRMAPTLALAGEYVRVGGTAFLWKGSRRDEELEEPSDWTEQWKFEEARTIGVENTAIAKFIKVK